MIKMKTYKLLKKFEKNGAVNSLSLEFEDREFPLPLGSSSCGKKTTLSCITSLAVPASGEIHIADQMANEVPPKHRENAMVLAS
jgi:multiple sugar transport system ATP-binding protein